VGKEVRADETVLLRHLPTSQWLASENVKYVNDFGVEYEVFGKSFLTTNKTQNLFAEKEGHKSANNALRSQGIQNEWKIVKG
jgi:type IV secretory pathway VirB4 component